MTIALAKTEGAGLSREADNLSQEHIDTIKRTIAVGATDAELKLFIHTCNRLRLDPFARQVCFVKRKQKDSQGNWFEKGESQVTIDGFRVVAERTGEYDGQDGPYWCGEDGVWKDVWLSSEPPRAAKVSVYRKGHARPLTAVARFDEYAQTYFDKQTRTQKVGPMWAKMPANQLAKCAEALALRKAFPNHLGGVYTPDEMGQAENDREPGHDDPPTRQLPRGKTARTLDDVAGVEGPLALTSDGKSSVPAVIDAEFDDGNAEPANVLAGPVDEYGLLIPQSPCPKFRTGKKYGGLAWNDPKVPAGYVREVMGAHKESMTSVQLEHYGYIVARREAEKAAALKNEQMAGAVEKAEQAGFKVVDAGVAR